MWLYTNAIRDRGRLASIGPLFEDCFKGIWMIMGYHGHPVFFSHPEQLRKVDLGINDSSQGIQTHRTLKVGELPSGTFDIGMEIRGWFTRKRIYIYLQILGFPHIWHHHLLSQSQSTMGYAHWGDFPAIFDSRRVGRSKVRQVHGLLSAFETLGGRKQADRGWMEFLGRLLDLDICIL